MDGNRFAGDTKKEGVHELVCQHPLFGESSFLEQNRVTSATVQRYTATLNEFLAGRAEVIGKVGRDGGGDAGTHLSRIRSRSWGLADGSIQVRRVDSNFLRSPSRRASAERLPSVCNGYVSRPSPVGCGSSNDGVAVASRDEEFAVMLVIQYVAYLRPSELCNLTAGQVIRPLKESGASRRALLLAPKEELKTSKTGECDESVLLDGHLSIAIGKVLTRYTAGKAATTPLWSRSQAKYAVAFAKWAETSGVHVITTHPYSVRHGGPSSDALWRTRSLVEIPNRGRWRSEKSVRRCEKHARLLEETLKLSTATRKYGQLVICRMPQLLEGA